MAVKKKRVPCIKTVGQLKQALKNVPDDTPLIIDNHGPGWGLKPPYMASYRRNLGDYMGYVGKDSTHVAGMIRLPKEACVIQPGTEHC